MFLSRIERRRKSGHPSSRPLTPCCETLEGRLALSATVIEGAPVGAFVHEASTVQPPALKATAEHAAGASGHHAKVHQSQSTGTGTSPLLSVQQINNFARSFEKQFNEFKSIAIQGIPQSQIQQAESDYIAGIQQAQQSLNSDLMSFPKNDFLDRQAAVQNYLLSVSDLQFNFWNEAFFGPLPATS